MFEVLILIGFIIIVIAGSVVGVWLDRRDRTDRHPKYTSAYRAEIYCVIRGCSRHLWSSDDRISLFATERGWAKTPDGWVCDEHVRDIRAHNYIIRSV